MNYEEHHSRPEPRKGYSLLGIIGGGLLFMFAILIMVVAIGAKIAFRVMARHAVSTSSQQNESTQFRPTTNQQFPRTSFPGHRTAARPPEPKFEFQTPDSLDESISFLKSRDFGKMAGAWEWFGNNECDDSEQRHEVCQTMLRAFIEYSGDDCRRPTLELPVEDVQAAVAAWFNDDVELTLKYEIRQAISISGPLKAKVICILAESGGVDVTSHMVNEIKSGMGRQLGRKDCGLKDCGPELAPYVIPLFNNGDPGVREEVRRLLRRWNVDEDLKVKQAISDLDADFWVSGAAVAFLSRHADLIDSASESTVASGVEKAIAKNHPDVDRRTYLLLERCYREPESSATLFEVVKQVGKKKTFTSEGLDHSVPKMLRDSESSIAIDALILAWKNGHKRGEIESYLTEINTPLVVAKLAEELDGISFAKDQERMLRVVAKLDNADSALFRFYCRCLESNQTSKIELALEWLNAKEFDASLQIKLSEPLSKAATSIHKTSQNEADELIEAITVWGDEKAAEKIVPFLDSQKSSICSDAAKALGVLKAPATYPALAKNLYRTSSGFRSANHSQYAKDAILEIGNDAEEAVLKNLDSLHALDIGNWYRVLGVIEKIGGESSVKTLIKFGRNLNSRHRRYRAQVSVLERTILAIQKKK